jgi:hypothetical protein
MFCCCISGKKNLVQSSGDKNKKNQDISLEIQVWDRYRDVAGLKTWLKIIFLCSEMFLMNHKT